MVRTLSIGTLGARVRSVLLLWVGCIFVVGMGCSGAGAVANGTVENGMLIHGKSNADRPVTAGHTRFRFVNATTGPLRATPVFATFTGLDAAGRFCRLDREGRFQVCTVADNRIEKAGRTWCDYGLDVEALPALEVPRDLRIISGRIYLSQGAPVFLRVDEATHGLVQPDPANPSDPNRDLIYDWVEFTLNDLGFFGNTTCVDQFGLPITLTVTDWGNPGLPRGPVGLAESRAALFAAYRTSVTPAFAALADPAGLRILAPAHAPAGLRDHFEANTRSLWDRYRRIPLVLTPDEGTFTGRVDGQGRLCFTRPGDPETYVIQARPTSLEIFLCNGVLAQGNALEKVLGAQLAALLNRHLLEDPGHWRSPERYYRQEPSNQYARFWHQHGLDHKAYAFPYDDVNDQSPSLFAPRPMEVRVAFRLD